MKSNRRPRREVRGGRGLALLLAACGLSPAAGGCHRSQPKPAETDRRSNLGVSPATWPQEGPSPIVGQMDPVDFAHNDVTGAVHRLVVDPANPAIVYAGSANGGIWKTTNATAALQPTPTRPHWATTSDALPSLSTGALAMDPLNSQHLIAGTGARSNGLPPGAEGLIYTTTNGGTSWATIDVPLLRNKRLRSIVVRGQTVLACATDVFDDRHGFLFRSANGGTDWSDLSGTGNLPASMGSAWDVVRDPSSTDRYYAVAGDRGFGGSGVYLGTAGGTSWTRISDSDTSPNGIAAVLKLADTNARLAVGPTGALFVLVASIGQPVYIGYTLNQGGSWTAMDLPTAATSPATPNSIVRITRGGVVGGQPTTILVDSGVEHGLTGTTRVRLLGLAAITGVNDLNGDWIARPYDEPTDGGTTPSKTRFVLSNRLTNADGDGTTAPFDVSNQGTWQFWVGPNGGGQGYNNLALAIDPTDPRYVYVGGDASPIHLVRGDANQPASTNIPSGQWTRLTGEGAADGFFPHADIRDMVLDPTGQFLFMSEDGGVFVRTNPRNATGVWASLAGDLMSVELRSIALDPLSHAVLGGAQDNGTPSEFEPSNGSPQHWQEIEFADGVAVAAVNGHTTDPTSGRPISYRYTSFQGSNDFELHTFDDTGAKLKTEFLINPNDPSASKLVVSSTPGDGGTIVKHLNDVENFDWLAAIGVNRVFDPAANPQPNPQKWLLIAGHNQGVWESRDLGETTALVPGSPRNATSFSYGNVTNVEALWVAAENGCCGSATTTFHSRLAAGETLTLEASFTSSGNSAAAVAMAANDPTIAYGTVDSRVYQIIHGDPVPHEVTGDLSYLTNGPFSGPGRLRSIVYVPSATNGDRIFVAAADGGVPGVFMMMVDNPGVWTRVGINLPSADAMALDYDAVNSMLVVGTGGRGAWSLTNATALDRAPKALCKNLTLSAGATCTATTTPAAFNNGSTDPDGNPLTITAVDPVTLAPITLGPFGPGTFNLAIKFADNQGAAALCKPTLTVNDTTPPVLTVPSAKSVTTCADTVSVAIGQATATDNCAGGLVPTGQVISRNGVALNPPIPVINGTASLSPGSYVVRWTISDGANPPVTANQNVTVGTGMEVSQSFLLDDRAQLRSATGGFAGLLNSGTGATRVGQDGRTAGVISRGPVTVQHRAIVAGNVVSGSTVTKDSDATINGTITENASIQLPALPTLPTFPPATLPAFTVNANTTQTKGPGSYVGGTVVNGGTLILQAGDYFFQSLTINSGATVRIPSTSRVFVRNTLTFNSPFLATSGSAVQPITLGFSGTTLNMFAVFNGTLIAPNATVVFGTGSGLTFTGQFFGRTFEVTPGSALVCKL